jgi:bifunctional non-homologous end joining protein LigD
MPSLPLKYTPQLATLVKEPPAGDEWLHELKYDGYRIGCRIDGRTVRLISRNGKDWTERFPAVAEAAVRLKLRRALLDGEVAAVLPDGRTSFQALQGSFASSSPVQLVYFLFDLLHLDGEDIGSLPLETRKARLRRLFGRTQGVLRYADHVVGRGAQVFAAACQQHAEGIVSKRRDRPYQAGRGLTWVKTKCIQRQEVIIGGFTDPEGSRAGIGALLVGVRDRAGQLVYAGKVGTGFTQTSARELRRRLEALEQRDSAFSARPAGRLGRTAHWVRPELVAEVAFTEWTEDGRMRHPSFQGLRADKQPAEVVRERPRAAPGTRAAGRVKRGKGLALHESRVPQRARTHDSHVAGVTLTHPDRVLYPDVGLTKIDLARFYEAIAEWALPHVAGRPLTLVRCPDGVGASCFYMKHAHAWGPTGLRRVSIREKTKTGEYLVADSIAGLISLVQMSVLEIHTWNATAARLERPDRIILDLDPGPDVAWPAVIAAARLVRTALEQLSLQSFVKTTGGRGLHVVVPLVAEAGWSECLDFSRALADAVVRLDPRTYTTTFAKAGREKQILLDYKRNNRGSTAVAAFSTRARPGAPVSVPLAWDELSPRLRSDHYTVRNLGRRLAKLRADPWQDYWSTEQRLSAEARRRLEDVH